MFCWSCLGFCFFSQLLLLLPNALQWDSLLLSHLEVNPRVSLAGGRLQVLTTEHARTPEGH